MYCEFTIGKIECSYCGLNFSRKDILNRHLDRCKIKERIEKEKYEIYQELLKKMEKLENQNKVIIKDNGRLTTQLNHYEVNATNSCNINAVSNINLVAFGTEHLHNIITDNICKYMFNKGFQSVPKLIEYVHFNKNKPEQHNVFIPNMRDIYAMIYDGFNWNLSHRNEVIDQLFEDKLLFLEEKFYQFINSLDDITKIKFQRFLDNSSDDTLHSIKNDIKLLLYNKRHMPIQTKKGMKNNLVKN